tara:strand:+ start:1924 stop:2124 length:201 start_codon:yes stop_codon:yes gene_type:complete
MTKDDILRMGREAGMHDPMVFYAGYERFARLVAGVEREEILQMSRNQWFKTQADFEAAIEARWKHD